MVNEKLFPRYNKGNGREIIMNGKLLQNNEENKLFV